MPSNLLTEVKATVEKRMEELRPSYLEYLELEAYAELTGNFQSPVEAPQESEAQAAPPAPVEVPAKPAATRQRPGSGKPAATKPAATKAAAKKPAAKKPAAAKTKPAAATAASDGETVAKVKEIVASHPDGIKIGEIIKEGNLSQSYTYDVVKRLTESKELVKRNRKIYIHQTSAAATAPKTTAPKGTASQPPVAA